MSEQSVIPSPADAKPNTRKVFVKTYGCQMNVYDSERMTDALSKDGYQATDVLEEADLILLNTCHIREKAAEKVYSELGRLREMKKARAKDGREMTIGRYYMDKRDYTGAINRFKVVVTQYQTTRHVEEALARLTEAYMAIGVVSEAQTAAAVLGHNFPDSRWYKDAYNLVKSGGVEPQENKGSYISKAFKKFGLG